MESCVAFVSDQRYLPLMMATATTAVNRSSMRFPIALLGFGVPLAVKQDVCAYFANLGVDIEFIDHSGEAHGLDWSALPVKLKDMSTAAYGRLILPELLSHHRNILYMDGDMLVDADLGELIANPPVRLAAVEAIHHIDKQPQVYELNPSLKRRRSYFNSGLFYINVDFWATEGAGKQVVELIKSERIKTPLHDQDYLNICFGDIYQRLDLRWNFTWPMSYLVPALRPFIVHFAGRLKPWDQDECRCPEVFSKVYKRLFAQMPRSVTGSIPELGFQEWERKRLRRLRYLLAFGKPSGSSWNKRHASVLEDWCGEASRV
ncbi:glycosyltransferase family 8 protein [Halochromatium roseum]|uniref:glycosyltransferase family 8 protein n=1 Tax=Halochromatium roseum TaxID=391920 RepID=UPI001913EA8C|nr:glycosyltransferase [Halochromatium roseum]MBK5940352.1 hypothetical protein [Halochromatium roseum]